MSTKVYRYGCKIPPKEIVKQIDEQLRLVFIYRLCLWRASITSRELYRQRRREHFPELEATENELKRQREIFSILDPKEDKKARQELKIRIQQLNAKHKEQRDAAKNEPKFEATVAEDRERETVLRKALRAHLSSMGLFYGTYMLAEEADKRAKQGKMDPAHPRWDGTGSLGIQLQGGRSAAQLFRMKDANIRIEQTELSHWENRKYGFDNNLSTEEPGEKPGRKKGARTIVHYRLCSKDHKAVFIPMQTMYHRALPEDSKVTWAKLVVGRSGERKIYSIQFTVESKLNERQEFGSGTVVVCLNEDTIKYADLFDVDNPQIFAFDPRLARVAQLQSTRDQERDRMVATIKGWMHSQEDDDDGEGLDLPEWLREEVERNTTNASCRKLCRLFRLWSANRIQNDEDILEKLSKWVYHENHLYQWQEDMRGNALRARKNAYRVFAAQMRRKYRSLIIDDRNLNAPELKTFDRNESALSEFRLILKQSFGTDFVQEISGVSCAEMIEHLSEKKTSAA